MSQVIQSVQIVKNILQQQLAVMEQNEPGMIARLDPEFLHDFRVAVRRARSIFSQVKGVLPDDWTGYFRNEFNWLGKVTSIARDFDVYLLDFDKLQLCLPVDRRDAVLPFRDFLLQEQEQAYRELTTTITSPRYNKLKQGLYEFFENNSEALRNAPKAKKNIQCQANRWIWRCYQRVKKQADKLKSDSPVYKFHELRKSCKKLRYMLEFFQNFYPENEMSKLIQQLKLLQDNLGEFQNLEAQTGVLEKYVGMMTEQGKGNADSITAMGILVNIIEQKKYMLRYAFAACYKEFSRQKYQKLFKKLFKPG